MYYAQKRTKDSDANIQCYKTTSMSILLEFLFEHNIQVIIIQIKGRLLILLIPECHNYFGRFIVL